MSTRAAYTFKDDTGSHHVYIHSDGYPSWAWNYFADTLNSDLAWPLPRYEADEFAAAFVAANKQNSGGVRLMKSPRSACDIEYAYYMWQAGDGKLMLRVQSVNAWDKWEAKTIWRGPLSEFIESKGSVAE